MRILGIIPARGGSKRVPRKNIKDFLGKPLLTWSAEVGIASKVFDRFILATDDQEIADVGKQAGLEVPFLLPAEVTTDTAHVTGALTWLLTKLKEREGYDAPWFILLEPSSPGRQPKHIKDVAELISKGTEFDSITGTSTVPPEHNPSKTLIMGADHSLVRPDGRLVRDLTHNTQNLPAAYYINSAIYAFKTANLFSSNPSLWGDRVYGYEMDQRYVTDINSLDDWKIAEMKVKELQNL